MNKSIIPWVGGKAKLMWLINLLAPPKYDRTALLFALKGVTNVEIKIFENDQFGKVRTIVDSDGTILFCGIDVAKSLGYLNPNSAVSRHCKGCVKQVALTEGGNQMLNFIPEPDVYRLIFRSKLPAALAFETWVVSDVLPALRRTGEYRMPTGLAELQPKADYFDAIVDTNLLTNVRTTAKELRIPERLFTFLLEEMDLAFRTPKRLLIPTAYMMNHGYAVLKEYSRNGHGGVYMLFTPLGRLYLLKRIRERLAMTDDRVTELSLREEHPP